MKNLCNNFLALIIAAVFIFAFDSTANSQTTAVLMQRAKTAIDKAEFEAALKDLNLVISREPANGDAFAQRSRVFIMQKSVDNALADAEKALEINPKDIVALNVRGLGKGAKNDYASAIADFTRAVAIDPKFTKAYINRGVAYRFLKNPDINSALADFTKAVEIEPKNAVALYQRANLYRAQDKFKEAIGDYDLLIGIEPKNDAYFAERAYSYGHTEKGISNSLADAEKSLALNPKNVTALGLRGYFKTSENYDSSNADFALAFSLKPDDAFLNKLFDFYIQKHPSPMSIELVQKKLTAYKTEVERSNQNLESYQKIDDFFKSIKPKQTAAEANDLNKWAAFEAEAEKPRLAYYESLVNADAKNVCAYYFMAKGFAYSQRKDLYDKAVNNFDGKRGAKCSAEAAFWAGRALTDGETKMPSDHPQALKFYNLALERQPDMPNVRNWMAKLAITKDLPDSTNSTSSSNRTDTSQTPEVDTYKVNQAIKEYDKVHSRIEADLAEYLRAYKKFAGADPQFRSFMRGTQLSMIRSKEAAFKAIDDFLKIHGKYLPISDYRHLLEDRGKFVSLPY